MHAVASEVVRPPAPPVRRSSSQGTGGTGGGSSRGGHYTSTTSIASTVATKRRLSKTEHSQNSVKTASKRGYHCCSKREKSSALAALIGCISLASLMTGLVTDLWVNTDEWIPSASQEKLDNSPAELPNLQPRQQEASGAGGQPHYNHQKIRRVHFAVGLWTVCPSHPDHMDHLKGTLRALEFTQG